jgi:hypothetical protein
MMIEVTFKNTVTGATARGQLDTSVETELVNFLNGIGGLTIGGIYPIEIFMADVGTSNELGGGEGE